MKENACSWFAVSNCAIAVIFSILLMMPTGCGDDSDNDNEAGAEELTAPVLISPTNGETVSTTTPTVSWGNVTGAVLFELEICTSSDFNQPIFAQQLPVTSFMISDFPISEGIHFWRVRAQSAAGILSPWSNIFSFTVIVKGPGGTPMTAIVQPSENVTIFTHGWVDFEGSVTGGDQMKSCLWDFGNGSTTPDMVDPAAIEYTTPGTYTVRFSVIDTDGDESSAELTVTVVDDTPKEIWPPDGHVLVGGSDEFSWNPMSMAESYILRIEGGTGPLEYTLTGTSQKVSGLSTGTYVWCVYGVDSEGNMSRCSASRTLTVQLP